MVDDDETLLYQLEEDIYNLLSPEYPDIVVKSSYEDFPAIDYPCVLIYEIENYLVEDFCENSGCNEEEDEDE